MSSTVASSVRRASRSRLALRTTVVLLCALLVLMALSLMVGSVTIPLSTILNVLGGADPSSSDEVIVATLRIPRTLVGVIAGAALGVAGALMQSMTRNPLAEPGVLGVNAGAALSVVLMLVFFPSLPLGAQLMVAFVGAAASGALVLGAGSAFTGRGDPVRLVLAGVATTAVLGSVSSFVVLAYPRAFENFRFWDSGALAARPGGLILAGAIIVLLALLGTRLIAPDLDALGLGTDVARSMGVSPSRAWALGSLLVVLLAGTATCLAGPIGLLGLLAPIGARAVLGPTLARLVPVTALLGAVILLGADIVGRIILRPAEIQASIICAAIGAVAFVVMARRQGTRL